MSVVSVKVTFINYLWFKTRRPQTPQVRFKLHDITGGRSGERVYQFHLGGEKLGISKTKKNEPSVEGAINYLHGEREKGWVSTVRVRAV